MTGHCILALDVGSQSVRAALIQRDGSRLASASVDVPAIHSPKPGQAEASADDFLCQIRRACERLRADAGDTYDLVAGIGLTSQRASTVFLDDSDRPLHPVILWSDQRRTPVEKPVRGLMGPLIALSGAASTVADLRARAPARWLARYEPDAYAATRRVVLLSSYLLFHLTGRWIDSAASQVGLIPFNFRTHQWHRRGNWRWHALGFRPDHQLVALCAPGRLLGTLSARGRDLLLLRNSTPVFATAADKACEVLGSGCRDTQTACASFGTAATVNLPHERYGSVRRFMPAYPSAQPGGYLSEVKLREGFSRVTQFLNDHGGPEKRRALDTGLPPEHFLEDLLLPAPERRDAATPTPDQQRRAQRYRTIIDEILTDLKQAVDHLAQRRRVRIRQIVVAGGGARSDSIMQKTADRLGLTAWRPAADEASLLGAAMCVAAGLGWYASVVDAAQRMAPAARPFRPREVPDQNGDAPKRDDDAPG